MAEALLKEMGGDRFEVSSAGLEPGKLNPLAVRALAEIGIDISKNKTKSVLDFVKEGRLFQHVITVCNAEENERCPIFPSISRKQHWNLPDPASFQGSDNEKLEKTRSVRDDLRRRIERWLEELSADKNSR
jgi:arsenate reductase